MDRKKFMAKLNNELSFLPLDEKENAIRFYEEYFDEAGIENEQNVISELVSAKNVAKKILKETKESDYNNFEDDILKNNNYKYLDLKNYKKEIENIMGEQVEPSDPNQIKDMGDINENIRQFAQTVKENPKHTAELLLTAYTPEEAEKQAKSETETVSNTDNISEINTKSKENNTDEKYQTQQENISVNENFKKQKSMSPTAKFLLICSLPITIPLALAFIALALSIFITVISAIFAIALGFASVMVATLAAGFALLVAGAGILAAAVSNIFTGGLIFFPTALALILISIGIILTYFSLTLSINIIKWVFQRFLRGAFKMLGKTCSGIFRKVVRW